MQMMRRSMKSDRTPIDVAVPCESRSDSAENREHPSFPEWKGRCIAFRGESPAGEKRSEPADAF